MRKRGKNSRMKLTSRFCPYCSNPNVTDGSYQEIGTFVIMDKVKINDSPNLFECPECLHKEDI